MELKLRWRLISFLALVIFTLLSFAIVILVARNLIFAASLSLSVSLLAYAAWLIFTGASRRHQLGIVYLIIGLATLVVELVLFLAEARNAQAFVAVLVVAAVYLVIIGILRNRYWQELRKSGETSGKTAHFRHPILIVNPKAGNGRAIKADIPELAKKQGINVVVTKKGDNIEALARQAARAGADVIGISGGDGSIGAAAKVALEFNLPLVVLPGGTRCHFARDLGLDPNRIADSLAGFTGTERRIDVANINDRIFLNNASFGLYADIVAHPEYREHKMEVSRKVLGSIATGDQKPYDLQFQHNNTKFKQAVQVLISVNSYNTVNISELGHRERLDGGVLQVTAVTRLNDALVKTLLQPTTLNKLSKLKSLPDFHQWEATKFEVTSSAKTLHVGVDGETETYNTPVVIKIMSAALRIFVPAEGVRNRPKEALSWVMMRRLWQTAIHGRVNDDNNPG